MYQSYILDNIIDHGNGGEHGFLTYTPVMIGLYHLYSTYGHVARVSCIYILTNSIRL